MANGKAYTTYTLALMTSTNSSTSTYPLLSSLNPTSTKFSSTVSHLPQDISDPHKTTTAHDMHAPAMCGVWHNWANHFVVFYLCPEFWTIIDTLHSATSLDPSSASNIATALTTNYLRHNLTVP
jgi:hypothetical protein